MLEITGVPCALQVVDLPAYHSCRPCGASQFEAALRSDPRRLDVGADDFEGQCQQCVTGQNCQRLAVHLVATGLTAAPVVVVHRGQIVVNQRVCVNHFDSTGCRQRLLSSATAGLGGH